MSEFSLIDRFFTNIGKAKDDVIIDIGDDAAVVDVTQKKRLAIAVDTFVEGVHFPTQTRAYDVGWKCLAVNLSDMAAMGAKPLWATLAITLPKQDDSWLAEFSRGFNDLATRFDVRLIGGDTTRGPLSITVNIFGDSSEDFVLTRSAAKPGDKIYVSGFLGDASIGLQSLSKQLPLSTTEQQGLQLKLNRPMPRVKEALALKSFINSAIDISDGLYADLNHILSASDVGALVYINRIPVSREYQWCCNGAQNYDVALTGGDDYELCVTVSAENETQFLLCAEKFETSWSCIGEIKAEQVLLLLNANNEEYRVAGHAYDHFVSES